jgi:hypothetical protein
MNQGLNKKTTEPVKHIGNKTGNKKTIIMKDT